MMQGGDKCIIAPEGKIVKNRKRVKKVKLNQSQVRSGVSVSRSIIEEVPFRKLSIDTIKEVQFARVPYIITQQGKQLAILLPLPE